MVSRTRKALLLIGALKLFKAVGLLVIGVSLLSFMHHDAAATLRRWLDFLRVDTHARLVERLLARVADVSPHTLRRFGMGTMFYALLFGTEGVGLIIGRAWAEYMTTGVTVSFLPIEGYELIEHPSVAKTVITLLNAAVVVYLVFEIRRRRQLQLIQSLPGTDPRRIGSD